MMTPFMRINGVTTFFIRRDHYVETVTYRTDHAIIVFEIQDVIGPLTELSRDYQNQDAQSLLENLAAAPGDPFQIPLDSHIFRHLAVQLLDSGEGQAICHLCNKTYSADQLTKFPIGAGDSPFNVRIKPEGMLKSLFQRKRHMPGMFGGKGFRCPAGHDLISITTWIS
jgi:hypothetical protein